MLFVTAAKLKTKTSLVLSLSPQNRPLPIRLLPEFGILRTVLSSLFPCVAASSSSQFLFKRDNARLFSLLWACFTWIRGNFYASENRCGPSSRGIALGRWRDRLLLWHSILRSAPLCFFFFLRSRSIKRELAIDDTVWEINASVLAWTVQGGRKMRSPGKKSERGWGNERWSKQNERSGLKTTHKHWMLGSWRVMQKDTDHKGNEEFDCFLFDELALKDQSNYSCKWSLEGLVKG